VFFNTMKRTFSHVGIYVATTSSSMPRARRRSADRRHARFVLARRFTGARRADLTAALPQLPVTR